MNLITDLVSFVELLTVKSNVNNYKNRSGYRHFVVTSFSGTTSQRERVRSGD